MAEANNSPPEQSRDEQVVWEPLPRQTAFITCPADDVAYGGARGGGKSDAVLGDWLSHEEIYGKDAIGIVLRRERTQLIELIERARSIYVPLGYSYKDVDKVFTGPKGGRLRFAYLERDADADAYQGHSYTKVYVEEAGLFPSEGPINKLQATLRSGQGVPCQLKTTLNPGGAGHSWCKARYRLDEFPKGMEVFKFAYINPFTQKTIEKTRLFIPSKISDNRYLGDAYVANLYQVGSAQLVEMWVLGSWDAVEGAFFDSWSSKNIIEPFAVPPEWLRFRSMDHGSAKPFSIGFWAVCGDDHILEDGRTIPRGALVRYREWYGASSPNVGLKLDIEQVAQGIIARSLDETFAYTVVDPSMFAQSGGPSLVERMMRVGLENPRRGDNRRVSQSGAIGGWDQMRARIRGDGETPALFVFSTCRDFIRTVPSLQHDRDRAEDLDTDGEDHVADEARYACMSRPYIAQTQIKPRGDRVVLMADQYGRVHYEDDAGRVDLKDVIMRHCQGRERQRREA